SVFSGRMYALLSVPFFFQAEDGIRDFHVTGVQTCALPIWCGGSIHKVWAEGTGLAGLSDRGPMSTDRALRRRGLVRPRNAPARYHDNRRIVASLIWMMGSMSV